MRHVARDHAAPFTQRESLELLVNGKSQGKILMPALLPSNAVGCVGTCVGSATVTPVAPAQFGTDAKWHGKHVTIAGGGASATWGSSSCNEVAALTHPHDLAYAWSKR